MTRKPSRLGPRGCQQMILLRADPKVLLYQCLLSSLMIDEWNDITKKLLNRPRAQFTWLNLNALCRILYEYVFKLTRVSLRTHFGNLDGFFFCFLLFLQTLLFSTRSLGFDGWV